MPCFVFRLSVNDSQQRVDYGQQRVNYELVQIDRKLLGVLKALVEILKTGPAFPASEVASQLQQIDFSGLEAAISRANSVSNTVACIIPPGCSSEQSSESFLKVARSLNLEGPPDWSSRLDDYLYDNQRNDE
ncbi:MAG TPA: hypothetical protein VN843_07840 [Anaerolineales bacterium]|nr:hypothetical protein [Anaerolineales bacterium]